LSLVNVYVQTSTHHVYTDFEKNETSNNKEVKHDMLTYDLSLKSKMDIVSYCIQQNHVEDSLYKSK